MDAITVILFNPYHIGDLFSIQQIVRAFAESNPTIRVELAVYTSFFLFSVLDCLPNVSVINIHAHPLQALLTGISKERTFIKLSNTTYVINFSGLQFICPLRLECHYMNLHTAMEIAVQNANMRWRTHLAMRPCTDQQTLIPCIPDTDCSLFDIWRDAHPDTVCIMYYNFLPCSGQSIGILPESHDRIIKAICSLFQDAAILVPMHMTDVTATPPPNLLYCEDMFGCTVAPDCENLCKLTKMELRCTVSVHFDIGACFYYAGSMLYKDSTCTILHASQNHHYYRYLKENFGAISEEAYAKKVQPLDAVPDTDVFIASLAAKIREIM